MDSILDVKVVVSILKHISGGIIIVSVPLMEPFPIASVHLSKASSSGFPDALTLIFSVSVYILKLGHRKELFIPAATVPALFDPGTTGRH